MLKTKDIDLNDQFKKAIDLLENTKQNVFITGKAGTGKSTLLEYFRSVTKKKIVVLAPTGVAALNVKGQTIHSFFKFKPGVTVQSIKKSAKSLGGENIYTKLDTIIIDEISMVRADLLDCIDRFFRLHRKESHLPFGGVQMICIGDLYQLPPVVTGDEREIFRTHYESPYFFSAKSFEHLDMAFLELEKIYRQKDQEFIELLNAVRNNSVKEEHLEKLNERYRPHTNPLLKGEGKASDTFGTFSIRLTTTNSMADEINYEQLQKLRTKEEVYVGTIRGNFDMKALPTDVELSVKVGAQVMMLNNDSMGRWVNGSIGKIVLIEHDQDEDGEEIESRDVLLVELNDGEVVEVTPFTWELFQFAYDKQKKHMTSETVGTFTQYPLRLAWAVTIHKSQGKTFDNVIIDIGNGTFAHGQMYVALSRCTSLEGITLKKPIEKKHIWMDWRVVRFVTRYQYQLAEKSLSFTDKMKHIENAITQKQALDILYLKANDVKSKRVITPMDVGEKEYMNRKYIGVRAMDGSSGEERVFRVDRILEMHIIQ